MNHQKCVVARYESIILLRNWGFRIFAILSLLGITGLQEFLQGGAFAEGYRTTLSSSIPWLNAYLFAIVQSVLVIFAVADIMARDKRSDTIAVFYVRPLSNADYIFGRAWGMIIVFVGLNLLSFLSALGINIFWSFSPLNPWLYLFYLATYTFPSLLFMIGLALWVSRWIKHQALLLSVLLLYVYISCIYLPEIYHSTFDFLGIGIPNLFSSITGHPNLFLYLLHHLAFLALGAGCTGIAAWRFARLSDRQESKKVRFLAFSLLLLGVVCCSGYFYSIQKDKITQKNYARTYFSYADHSDLRIERNDITYHQQGSTMDVLSELQVKNTGNEELKEIILYLNPGLTVEEITTNGKRISFDRENQVIIAQQIIEPNEEITLQVKYKGFIDERICYLDVAKETREDTRWLDPMWRYGKRYAFLESKYTLLTPECLWYPVTVPPVNLKSKYATGKNFSVYTLQVVHPENRTVISQGKYLKQGDTIQFNPAQRLTGISLCMGTYEKESIKLDSVSLEVYYVNKDYWNQFIFKETQDHITTICENLLQDYPFPELRLVEIPITFTVYMRNWKGGSELVQPALLFFPEKAITIPQIRTLKKGFNSSVLDGKEELSGIEAQINQIKYHFKNILFHDQMSIPDISFWEFLPSIRSEENRIGVVKFIYGPNLCCINPMYSDYVSYFYSKDYPIIDQVFSRFPQLKINDARWVVADGANGVKNERQQAHNYLIDHSLHETLTDKELNTAVVSTIFDRMSLFLKNKIATKVNISEFDQFLLEFKQTHLFQEIKFEQFCLAFSNRFEWDFMDWLPVWYNRNKRPVLIIKDIQADLLQLEEAKKYPYHFKVYNPTNEDAILSTVAMWPSPNRINTIEIKAGESKEIRFINSKRPFNVVISTGLSENIPTTISWTLTPETFGVTSDTSQGVFDIDPVYFQPIDGEIIVDNEDPGFSIDEESKYQRITTTSSSKPKTYMTITDASTDKWIPIIENNCYGSYILSAYARLRKGKGSPVSWTARIPEAGQYEIWAYIPYIFNIMGITENNTSRTFTQSYLIRETEEEREVSFDILKNTGWIFLGECKLPEGDNKVTLLDKGEGERIVIADAIKWKRINK